MNKNMIRVIENPVILQNLCTMRNKNTDSQGVRIATRKITRVLLYEAAKNLPLVEKEIDTPIVKTKVKTIENDINIIISPILRAGLIFTDEAIDILPQACIRHIGMYRDEETLIPHEYFAKFPKNLEDAIVMVVDPMLATGGSAVDAISAVKSRGAKQIKLVCLVGAPEGVKAVTEAHPDVDVYLAALDDHLNEHGYIVPGLGDAGDRIFGTK